MSGSTLFEDCLIYNNQAESCGSDAFGGGMNLWGGGAPTLHNCEIYSNVVDGWTRAFGGGVDIDNTDAIIEADTFIHDNAITATTGNAYGGGVSIGSFERVPTPIIRDSRVMSNICQAHTQWCYGGGVGFADYLGIGAQTQAIIRDSLIAYNIGLADPTNSGVCGGGIGMTAIAVADRFDSNIIYDNLAYGHGGGGLGGGICLTDTNIVSVTNNLLYSNEVDDYGGGPMRGGGIYANGPGAYIVNNTIVANTSNGDGGGVYLNTLGGFLYNDIVVDNHASNDGGGVFLGVGGIADNNDVWSNTCSGGSCGADYDSGSTRPTTDINADPLFIGSGDLATGYHLRQGSPCIDAGLTLLVPNNDYDDQSRPLYYSHDIGFDEVEFITGTKLVNLDVASPGMELVYTLVVTNPDPIAPAMGGWITDVIPISTTYASGPNCNLNAYDYDAGSRTVWWHGDIPASTILTCDYAVTVNDGLTDGTQITNTFYFTLPETMIGGWSNVVTTTIYAAGEISQPVGGFTLVFTTEKPPLYLPTILRPAP